MWGIEHEAGASEAENYGQVRCLDGATEDCSLPVASFLPKPRVEMVTAAAALVAVYGERPWRT
jgi:hypothetical protein